MRYKKILQETQLTTKTVKPVVMKETKVSKSFKTYLENRVEQVAKIPPNKWVTLDDSQKETFGPELIEIVGIAYANTRLGSFVRNQNDVNLSNWIVLSLDGGQSISCAIFYRTGRPNESWVGNKVQGLGHDGKTISRRKVVMHLKDMLEQNGWWIECRDAVAKALHRAGAPIVKDESLAAAIFPNTGLHMTDNNGSYTRHIAGRGTALTDETIFGKPVLKKVSVIKEYIETIMEADEDWLSIKDVLGPGHGIVIPTSHADQRAELRKISADIIRNSIGPAIKEKSAELARMPPDNKVIIINNKVDFVLGKTGVGDKAVYDVITVHPHMWINYDPNQFTLVCANARNKRRRENPKFLDTMHRDYSDDTGMIRSFQIGDKHYSYRLDDLKDIAAAYNKQIVVTNARDFFKAAHIAVQNEDPVEVQKKVEKASIRSVVYLIVRKNQNVVIVAHNPYTVLALEATANYVPSDKKIDMNAVFVPFDGIARLDMNSDPHNVTETMFKKYLEKLEVERPAPSVPSMLVEEPDEEQLLISVEALREHFRMLEGSKIEINAHRVGDSMWIDWFSVPNRGQGDGRKAYEKWEQNLPQDIKTVRLHASDAGEGPSHGFWDAMGFDYEFPDDDNQMIKHLRADTVSEAKEKENEPEDDNLIIKIGDLAEKYECSLGMIEIELRRGIKAEMADEEDFMKAKDAALKNLNKSLDYYKKDSK